MDIAFFIPPLALLGYLAYRNTNYGIYIILATIPGYLLRTQVWFVPTTWLELAIYTVAAVSLYKHVQKKTLAPHWYYTLHHARVYIIPALIFSFAALASAPLSPDLPRALGIIKAWFFDPLLFSILLLDKLTSETVLKRIYCALSISAIPIMLYGFVEYMGGFGLSIPGRLDSFFESPNYAAMYLVPLSLLIAGYVLTLWYTLSRLMKIYSILWIIGSAATIIFTKSFGGWFSALCGTLFLILFYKKVTFKKCAALLVIFAGLVLFGLYGYQKSKTHYNAFWNVNSFETRREVWTHALAMMTRSPIIGVGLGGFRDTYASYIQTLPRGDQPIEKDVLWPHNIYLTLWVESGVVALAAFLWIALIFYSETLHAYFQNKNTRVIGSAAAIAAILLHGLVDTPYLKNDLSLLFWIIIVLSIVQGKQVMARKGHWHI